MPEVVGADFLAFPPIHIGPSDSNRPGTALVCEGTFIDSPHPHARGSRPGNPLGTAMTHPKSTLAAAPAAAAQSAAANRDERTHVMRAQHARMANAIRALAMDGVEQAKSGHP